MRSSSPRFLRPLPLVVALASVFGLPAPSTAADKPGASKPAPETADSLYNQGNEAYDRGDFALAAELFSGAFKLRQSYDIARNLGLAELKLGRHKEAIGHFEYSLSIYPSNRAETKKQVIEWLAQAKAEVGFVRLLVDPEAAACTLRGAPVPPAERETDILVDPGDIAIECKHEGHRTERRTVKIERGKREEVTLTLAPTGAPAPSGSASASTGGPPPGGDTRMILTWAGAATAAAGLGLGVVMGVTSLVKAGEADGLLADMRSSSGRQSPCASPAEASCGHLLALRKEQDVFGNLAFWMLLGGGLAGGGTAAYFFLTRPADAERPAPAPAARRPAIAPALRPTVRSIVPVAAPGGAALTLSGSF